uniref:Superoxide dismutase (SOD-1) gene exon 5 and 3' flanking region n=1 Tax=Homo sapiens TaxID=9606 RepID=V9H1G5_HUMAN|nr:unnamed protein product [Homo sapiens]
MALIMRLLKESKFKLN